MKHNKEIFEEALNLVCELTDLNRLEILRKSRFRNLVNARKILVYYMKCNYDLSWVDMAKMINFNHATIIHYYKCVKYNYMYDKDIRNLKFSVDLIDETGRVRLRKKIINILRYKGLNVSLKVNALIDLIEDEKKDISR